MFALLETRLCAAEGIWERLLPRGAPDFTFTEEAFPRYLRAVLDWPCNAGCDRRERRLRVLCRKLYERGIRGTVLPAGFPFAGAVEDCGLTVSSPVPLYRRLASRAAVMAAGGLRVPPSALTAALLARKPGPLLTEAVRRLAPLTGTVWLWAGRDSAAYCESLRRFEGLRVTAQEQPMAHLYILYEPLSGPLRVPDGALVFNFSGEDQDIRGGRLINSLSLTPPASWLARWPQNTDTPSLLAALLAEEQLGLGDIVIERKVGQWPGGY